MYIVDQDRSNVVNIGNVKSIALSGKRITPMITHLRLTIQNRGGKKYLNSYLGMLFLLI